MVSIHKHAQPTLDANAGNPTILRATFCCGETKLVEVKEEEWQRRTSKVMSQAKPQLDVVRELFDEGRELGYEEVIGEEYEPIERLHFFPGVFSFCESWFSPICLFW